MEYVDKFNDTKESLSKFNCFSLPSSMVSSDKEKELQKQQQQQHQQQQQSKDSPKSSVGGRFVLQAAVNASDWMYDLCQINTSITLKDIKIPGSNDSGSYSYELQPFGTTIQTQNLSIKEQLHAGVRYLDIRIGPSQNIVVTRSPSNIVVCNKTSTRLFHLEGTTLETILYDIKEFCNNHNECIIIEISPALYNNDFQADQKFICLDTITKFFGGEEKRKEDKYKYIIPARKVPDIITSVPLCDVLNNIYTVTTTTTTPSSSSTTSEQRQQPSSSSSNNYDLDTVYGNHHRLKKDMLVPSSSPEISTASSRYLWQQQSSEKQKQQQQQQQQRQQHYHHQKNTATTPTTTNSKIILLLNDRFIENEFEDEDVDERFYCMTSKVLCHPRYNNNNYCNNNNNTSMSNHNSTYNTKDNTIQTLLDKNLDNLKRYESFKYFINTKFVLPNSYTSTSSSTSLSSTSISSNTFKHPFTMLNTIIRNGVGGTAIKPITAATQLYDSSVVDDFLLQHSSTAKWRICTFDFIDLCPDILDLIISMNFAHTTTTTTTTASASYQQMNSNHIVNKNNSYSNDTTPWLNKTGRNFISMKQPKPELKINFALIESIKDTSTSNDTNQFKKILTPDDLLSQHHLYNNTIIYFKDPINELHIPDQYRTSNNYFRCTVGYTVRRNCNNNQKTNTVNTAANKKSYHVVTIPFKGDTIYPLIVAPYFCMIHGSDVVMLDVHETDRTVTVTGNCKRNHKGKYTLDLMTLATVVNFFLCNKKNLYTKKITFMLN